MTIRKLLILCIGVGAAVGVAALTAADEFNLPSYILGVCGMWASTQGR